MARKRSVRIDMTAMVDVAFLLLIFFMSTTQFRPPESVAVQLPTSTSEIRVPETDTIIITLTGEGRVFISSAAGTDIQEVPPEALLEAVLAWRSRNPDAVVVLKGDRNAAFGQVADLMDVLAESKTLRFNLMTDLERKGEEYDQEAAERREAGAAGAPEAPAPPEPGTAPEAPQGGGEGGSGQGGGASGEGG